jgi:hypothetical protein
MHVANTSFCIQIITIEGDTVAPIIICPIDVTLECTDSTDPASTGMATATDNCDITVIITYSDAVAAGSCPQEMTITRTWTATDDCLHTSTCVQIITVDDSQAPMLTCPADITIDCLSSTDPMDIGIGTATDNCDTTPVVTFTEYRWKDLVHKICSLQGPGLQRMIAATVLPVNN